LEISKDQIDQLCRLARLELGPGEEQRLRADLGRILAYMKRLRAVDTTGMDAMIHASESPLGLRADRPGESRSSEAALREAPVRQGSFFAVPAVVELTRKDPHPECGADPPEGHDRDPARDD
jgi:aspartyl-tRNA(Asn)/glutamyl-tRNA(Gln) amidotransferase subunit C